MIFSSPFPSTATTHRADTMNDSDKIKMTINIAGETIPLTVPFGRQDMVRDTETCVAQLFDSWRLRFPKKSEKQLLAMIAYQFASFYLDMSNSMREATEAAEALDSHLDSIIPH